MYDWPSPVSLTFNYVFRHFMYDSPFSERLPFSERYIFSCMIYLFTVWFTFSCMIDFSSIIHLSMYDCPCNVWFTLSYMIHLDVWLIFSCTIHLFLYDSPFPERLKSFTWKIFLLMYDRTFYARFTFSYTFHLFLHESLFTDSPFHVWLTLSCHVSPFHVRTTFSFMIYLFMYDLPIILDSPFHLRLAFTLGFAFSCKIQLVIYDSLSPLWSTFSCTIQFSERFDLPFPERSSVFRAHFTFSPTIRLFLYDSQKKVHVDWTFHVWFTFCM